MGYLVRAFAVGHSVMDHLADPYVMRMMELDRKVANEEDMMDHFSDRFPNENFIMYDCNRKIAAVHEAYHACVLVSGENIHIPEKEEETLSNQSHCQ